MVKSYEDRFVLLLLSVMIGVAGGYAAIVLHALIAFIHDLFFLGKINFQYNVDAHLPKSIWKWGVMFVPVVGAIIVTVLIRLFSDQTRGHGGVPEVMQSIFYDKGKMTWRSAIKPLAAAVTIGSGGSVGREGPIIKLTAVIASKLSQWFRVSVMHREVLIAVAAAAGIAGTFDAPIGGILFAIELLLIRLSVSSIVMITTASVIATHLFRYYYGFVPVFSVSASLVHFNLKEIDSWLLFIFIPFGVILGAASAMFTVTLHWSEQQFRRYIKNPFLRHGSAMLCLGIMLFLMMHYFGHYYVEGIGYATVLDILQKRILNPWFLLLLFTGKLFAMCLTFGSGGPGGIFSPALFLGATLGALLGVMCHRLFPGLNVNVTLFAIVGIAAMVGSSTGAVLTGIVMTLEQTRAHAAVLPMILATGIAYAVRYYLVRESIYTLPLARRGFRIPSVLLRRR